jgi:hypothetical protein
MLFCQKESLYIKTTKQLVKLPHTYFLVLQEADDAIRVFWLNIIKNILNLFYPSFFKITVFWDVSPCSMA